MNIPKIHPAVYVVAGIAAAYAIYRVVDKVLNPNKGTPYEGGGAVGTLGNVVNTALGGAPAAVGSSIGLTLYDWTHSGDKDPTSPTLIFTFKDTGKAGAVDADEVDSRGYFTYWRDGKRYKLQQDGAGKRYAVAA